jgi:hypothetical protein
MNMHVVPVPEGRVVMGVDVDHRHTRADNGHECDREDYVSRTFVDRRQRRHSSADTAAGNSNA